MYASTSHGEHESLVYNEKTFLLSCRTMLYSLQNTPKNFEDFVGGHFRKYGAKILEGCKSYMAGAQVGSLMGDGVHGVDKGDKTCSENFKTLLKALFEDLKMELIEIGLGWDGSQTPSMNLGASKAKIDTTLSL